MALRTLATAATILCIMLPLTAHGQSAAKTECNDGTRTTATGAHACDGHGGLHGVHTTILHRAPSGTQTREPGRVAQAGTPAPSHDTRTGAAPEERRGWRWAHRHDDRDDNRHSEERRRDEERHRIEERRERERDRVRCRDGRYDEVKRNHGKGKGPEVCKHHGGVAY